MKIPPRTLRNNKNLKMTQDGTKDGILNAADELFAKFGIRTTTIDDVCRAVGISKKTFYQFYECKEELVASVMRYHHEKKLVAIKEFFKDMDPVQVIKLWISVVDKNKLFETDRRLAEELHRYYPDTFARSKQEKGSFLRKFFRELFADGVKSGYFREDVDVDAFVIIAAMAHKGVIMYRDGEIVTGGRKMAGKRLMDAFKSVMVHTLLSDKGWEYYRTLGEDGMPEFNIENH